MKRKINIQLVVLTVLAISATLVMIVGIFYELFRNEMLGNLKAYTHLLSESGIFEQEDYDFKIAEEELRITLINEDGKVYYDSRVDATQMDNHANRPEVIKALKNGEGSDIRYSTTLAESTFYYALKLDNGTILRVAQESKSIWSIFESAFPAIGIFTVVVFGICIVIAHFMTKSLVAPIEQLAENIESCDSISAYKELVPFINTIQKQHEDIMKGAKMRQEFTANVSHELKTPLTAISGYAELIESGMASNEDVRHFATEIHRNSNRLLALINDIIQLSELDTIEVEVSFAPVELYQVAASCVEMLQVTAQQNDVKLILQGMPARINANRVMIEEVIVNLCDNAIRYNNKGGKVEVTVTSTQEEVILSIKDTGIGISEENQQRIFERFYRVDRSRSKSSGGTGLGLAIVKHIVVKHHAYMEVTSELGKGTEIKVIFKNIEV
ncbi:MAG: GHKL domain-containing protein [Cellulosilyticum sp.]|nr:GHKL domain-containing protein [Cellulosilyticum sp.]